VLIVEVVFESKHVIIQINDVTIIKQLNYVKKPWCCVIKVVDPFF